jgi:hypothetical protein
VHELRFAAGDVVDVAVMGAEVPHFTASAVFPPDVTVSDPVGMTDVSKGGFGAAWSSAAAEVHVLIAQQNANVDCTYTGSAGSGQVPASALSDLVVGAPVGIVVASNARVDTTAGPYAVEVLLAAYGIQASGTVAP